MATLNFKGKAFVQNHHLSVQYHQLIPQPKKSLSKAPGLNDNLIIHGDNLKALKSLLPLYAGKVKCIYIDPPYNTGNENWIYNDNVASPMMKEWFGKVVDREDLTRHDKWLSMMMPRLQLLHDLLSTDGAIFVSIDDIEQHTLRMLCDEVFGEGNFVANILWQKRTSPDARVALGAGHDFIVCYAKDAKRFKESLRNLELTEEQVSQFKNPDKDPKGPWVSSDFTAQGTRPNQLYKIKTPGGVSYSPPEGKCWKNIETAYKKLLSDGRMWFGVDGKAFPRRKTYLSEREGSVPWTWWTNKDAGHNQEAKKEITEIFSSATVFDTPKPTKLIRRILEVATDGDSIVLDSFAGSGTTAHAVLAQNIEDDGNRRFILVEGEKYADNVTAERVRRVIKGVKNSKDESLEKGLGGSFTYCELGPPFDVAHLLEGKDLPSYEALAKYVFHTATGANFDAKALKPKEHYIGSSARHDVYLWYLPDVEKLKNLAFTLDDAEALGKPKAGRRRLVFAPLKYVDQEDLDALAIDFVHLPYEIYERIP